MDIKLGDQLWYVAEGRHRKHEYIMDIEEVHDDYLRIRHTLPQFNTMVFKWYFKSSPEWTYHSNLKKKLDNGTAAIVSNEPDWEV